MADKRRSERNWRMKAYYRLRVSSWVSLNRFSESKRAPLSVITFALSLDKIRKRFKTKCNYQQKANCHKFYDANSEIYLHWSCKNVRWGWLYPDTRWKARQWSEKADSLQMKDRDIRKCWKGLGKFLAGLVSDLVPAATNQSQSAVPAFIIYHFKWIRPLGHVCLSLQNQ